MNTFHPLEARFELPPLFTYPFCYEPHPLCLAAAREVQAVAGEMDVSEGKMFGVLVVRRKNDGAVGFLAAYSGLLCGRNDWPYFVPPVYDAQQPDGYFKRHEALIDALNRHINELETAAGRISTVAELQRLRQTAQAAIARQKELTAQAKQRRDALRQEGTADEALLIRESQYMKAELHRLKRRYAEAIEKEEERLKAFDHEIDLLKEKRRHMSDDLQAWLFDQYTMLNARGEARPLTALFAATPTRTPPAGSGDCCAPKLLQHAYLTGLKPLCMAEFWWGPSPVGEVRHAGRFYPACQGKCRPILSHMLQGLDVQPDPMMQAANSILQLETVYEDEWLLVVNKPAGLLSVPGRGNMPSVVSLLGGLSPVHRLDMATSGLLVVARTEQTFSRMQRLFAQRKVQKEYVALVDGIVTPSRGTIELPIAPDYIERPRQRVDWEEGKAALTEYEVEGYENGMTRLRLYPHTGRTHQLRIHCAHPLGLNMPIHGDELYGQRAERMCLHAQTIRFTHPMTGEALVISSEVPF